MDQGYAQAASQSMCCNFLIIWIKFEQSLVDLRKFYQKKVCCAGLGTCSTCVLLFPTESLCRKNNTIFSCVYNVIWMLHTYIPSLLLFCLIQDAKEHLFALADKLGPSLKDIDVCYLIHIVTLFTCFITKQVNTLFFANIVNQVFSSTN